MFHCGGLGMPELTKLVYSLLVGVAAVEIAIIPGETLEVCKFKFKF